MEQEILLLKGQVEKLSLVHPSFSIASELGELTVKNLKLGNLQDELDKIKQNLLQKENMLKESLESEEVLTQHVRTNKNVLT